MYSSVVRSRTVDSALELVNARVFGVNFDALSDLSLQTKLKSICWKWNSTGRTLVIFIFSTTKHHRFQSSARPCSLKSHSGREQNRLHAHFILSIRPINFTLVYISSSKNSFLFQLEWTKSALFYFSIAQNLN